MHKIFNTMNIVGLLLGAALSASIAEAAPLKPNPTAPQGGNMTWNVGAEPPTIHPVMAADVPSGTILGTYVCETLIRRNPNSGDWEPWLAEKFEVSKDAKLLTFTLRNAVFHDGTPVTAEDVKFSIETIRAPEHLAANKISYLEGIEKMEVVNDKTIKFHMKNSDFSNLPSVGNVAYIISKKAYGDIKKSVTMSRDAVCTGPYKVEKFERGQRIVVKKFPQWHGANEAEFKGQANFETVTFRFMPEQAVEIEAVKKGDIDLTDWPMRPDSFYKLAEGPMFGKSVFKVEAENKGVRPYGFSGWNFKNPIFQDKGTRQALAYLFNREELNKKFRYGKSELATGPYNRFSEYADPNVKPFTFDAKKAKELLAKSGWKDADKDGVLEKTINGKVTPFRFTMSYASKDAEKYMTFYKEDLKKAGIDMELKYMEWNSFTKMLDEMNFDAISMSWGAGDIDWTPRQIWHSSAIGGGGSNFISYKSAEVDKLIEEGEKILDRKKRIEKLRKVYRVIADDAPYAFWFNNKYDLYIYSSKVVRPGDSFDKDIGVQYWWSASAKMN